MDPAEVVVPLPREGLLIEPSRGRCTGGEHLLVPGFAAPGPGERWADLGCGGGVLMVLLALFVRPSGLELVGLEIQEQLADRATRNLELNRIEGEVRCGDLRDADPGLLDGVVTNPPYFPPGWGRASRHAHVHASTHEIHGGLGDFLAWADRFLKPGGRLVILYTADRLTHLAVLLADHGFGIDRLSVVHPVQEPGKITRVLVDASRGGKVVAARAPITDQG